MSGPLRIPDAVIDAALAQWYEHDSPGANFVPAGADRDVMRSIIEAAFHSICDANADRWSDR